MTRKHAVVRPYAPAYMSRQTLAYVLDLSPSAIDDRVRAGDLPRPILIGSLQRWRWEDVDSHVRERNSTLARAEADLLQSDNENDPFVMGIERVKTKRA